MTIKTARREFVVTYDALGRPDTCTWLPGAALRSLPPVVPACEGLGLRLQLGRRTLPW